MNVQSRKRQWPTGDPGVYSLDDPGHVHVIIQSTIDILKEAHQAIEDRRTHAVDEEDALLLETTQKILTQCTGQLLPEHDLRNVQTSFPRAWMYVLQLDRQSQHSYQVIKQTVWQAARSLEDLLRCLSQAQSESKSNLGPMQDRFSFDSDYVMFDGVDLNLAPKRLAMLLKMVNSFGRVVPYTDFNRHYSSADPGTVLKDKTAIAKTLKKCKVPCEIEAKKGVGYLIRAIHSNTSGKTVVTK